MPTNVTALHYWGYFKQRGRQDIIYDLTIYGAHIGAGAKGKIALHSFSYIAPAGCLNDGTPQFNLRAKIGDGKKPKPKPVRHGFIHLFTSALPPSILSSLSSSHHLVSCAPSMPQHHVGPDLLNFPPHLWLLEHLIFSSIRPICVLLQRAQL